MGSDARPLHMLFFPLMAPGHMLPMVDMAKLFAIRGVKATVLTTPANAPPVQAAIDDLALIHTSVPSPVQLHLHLIAFPSTALGLLAGRENISLFPMDEQPSFITAVNLLRDPFRRVLADLHPDAVVTDSFLPWTFIVAEELNIPRLVFSGPGFFSLCAMPSIGGSQIPSDNTEVFTLPNFPRRIELLRSQLPDPAEDEPVFSEMFEQIAKWEPKSYGVVVNSFYELEAEFADYLRGALQRKAWHVGPVSLGSNREEQRPSRGRRRSTSSSREDIREHCLKWLDEKEKDSVLYVAFGSMGWFTEAQFRELALGLEACGREFIWAIKNCREEWWPEGYMERMQGRCLILTAWAPQISILGHHAVGGFVTHCGWNSTLEAVSAGVPMVTWPFFAEQFINEKLIVEVLRIGVPIGAKQHTCYAEKRPLVAAAEIAKIARSLMDESEEATRMRLKAKELAFMAKNAIEEGGSSHRDLGNLIRELMKRREEEQHG